MAITETGPNLFQMMENAGRALARQALEMLGDDWQGRPIVVLAGGGGMGAAVSARPGTWPTVRST